MTRFQDTLEAACLLQALSSIDQYAPALIACSTVSASNASLELLVRVVEDFLVESARLEPYSLDSKALCILEYLLSHGWWCDNAQRRRPGFWKILDRRHGQ